MTDSDVYFGMSTTVEGDGTWFHLAEEIEPFEMLPGLQFQPVCGEKLLLNLVTIQPNTVAPVHAHDEEQISYVLEGEFEFEVNGEKRLLRPGMGVLIPANVPHGARTYERGVVELDIFAPPRKALLAAMKPAAQE
jgi:quercetin dioxygenase-like cupin family protein